jgi:hypothetical protein
VVAGSLGFVYVAAALYPVYIPAYQLFILGSTVWIIYTADRLLDTFRNPQIKSTRHKFQFTHRKLSLFFLIGCILLNGWMLLLYKPTKLIIGGLWMALFMVVYFLLKQILSTQKKWFPFKEVFIAMGYSMGIMLLPFSNSNHWPNVWIILWGYIFIVALINVLVIGSFERKEDWVLGEKSIIHLIQPKWEKLVCVLLSMVGWVMVFFLNFIHPVTIFLMILQGALLLPLFFREKFSLNLRYRLWEDGVLMLPIPVLIFDSFLYF